MNSTYCLVNYKHSYDRLEDIDIPLDKVESLYLKNCHWTFLCVEHPLLETKLKNMNNLKFLIFGNPVSHNELKIINPIYERYNIYHLHSCKIFF
jgi:hypothetical protein